MNSRPESLFRTFGAFFIPQPRRRAGANFYDFKLEYKDARPDYTDSGTGFIGNVSAGIVLRLSHLGITLGADYGYISRPHSTTITPRVGLNLNF